MYQLLKILPAILLAAGSGTILWWVFNNPTREMAISGPYMDGSPNTEAIAEIVNIGKFFTEFSNKETFGNEVWPGFRGAKTDNIHRSNIPLLNHFNGQVPNILWKVELGEGHGGAAIYDGMVYILDYDEELRADMLRCFSLSTGEELWRRWYNVLVRRNHGMSRTVPAVTEDYILTIGPLGHVMCVDRKTGDLLWTIDLTREYNAQIPLWYTGQCPLIDNGVAVIAPGGSALMIGVDCTTGEVLWETPNPYNWKMSHSSIIPFEFGNRRMFVYSAIGGAVGVAADGADAGSILWKTSEWNHPVVAASPVPLPNGRIFLTAGYGAGSSLLQLTENNGSFDVEVIKSFSPGEGLSSEQQTPIFSDGHLFGVMPKDARILRNQFVCVNPDDLTQIVWSSGPTARFGLGPYILADGKFYLLNDDGTLYIIEKSTSGYKELDRIKLFYGQDAWAPLAVADGFMVLRDSKTMICIDLRR